MKTTTNYSLKKPELNDYVNVNDLNDNADKIDTELKKISDAIGNLPDLNTNEKTALVLSINELLTKIGNTSSLTTDKKNNLVDALNELKQHLTAHLADDTQIKHKAKQIGLEDTNNLFTATELEGAMQELFTNVSNGKSLVGGAITDIDPNVIIPTDPTFQQLANAIKQISTGKKWATGTGTAPSNYPGDFIVDGLDFTPSIVALRVVGSRYSSIFFREPSIDFFNIYYASENGYKKTYSPATYDIRYSSTSNTRDVIHSNGFSTSDLTDNETAGKTVNWLAIE